MSHATRTPGMTPLPLVERRPTWLPAVVWSGFCAAFVCVLIGAQLRERLGTLDAMLAVVVGNWLLFLYTAGIGFACGRWGMSFSLAIVQTFGPVGARLPAVLMAALVAGWFSVQLDLTAALMQQTLQVPAAMRPVLCVVLGAMFVLPLFAGPRAGLNLTAWALPAMLLFGAMSLSAWVAPRGASLFDGAIGFSDRFVDGVAIAFGTFVVSATMTGDIVRVCRTGSAAVGATGVAFLLSNLPFMLLGVVLAAVQVDPIATLAQAAHQGVFGQVLVGLAVLSSWAACEACLVNASLSLTHLSERFAWWAAVGVVGIAGVTVAVLQQFPPLFDWILLLTVLVPPIGSVMLADYYLLRAGVGYGLAPQAAVNWTAVAGAASGAAAAALLRQLAPHVLSALVGMLVAAAVQLLASCSRRCSADGRHADTASGAEASDA